MIQLRSNKWDTHGATRRAGLAALTTGSTLGTVRSVHDEMEDEKASRRAYSAFSIECGIVVGSDFKFEVMLQGEPSFRVAAGICTWALEEGVEDKPKSECGADNHPSACHITCIPPSSPDLQ